MKYFHTLSSLLILLFFICSNGFAQDTKEFKRLFRDAEYSYQIEDYDSAISTYTKMIEMDPGNNNLHFLIGYSYLLGRYNREIAISHLEFAIESVSAKYREGVYHERNAPVLAYFLLGRAYHKNYQFEEAIQTYKKYQEYLDFMSFAEIEFVKRQIRSCDLAKEMIKRSIPVDFITLENLTSTYFPCAQPVVSGSDSVLIYSVDRPDGNSIAMITKTGGSWSKPRNLDVEINISGNFYPASLSYDGKDLYLVYKDILISDLYVSHYDGNHWSEPENLGSAINSKYYETHASISKDGNSLYFTSNRKGGWGGMDLYKSVREPGGHWQESENLGYGINTYYNEETPFFSENDSVLYFSSDGFENMGGYDIFVTRLDKDGFFTEPQNLGYPISTPDDDLFYNPGWNGTRSYYARQPEDNLSTSIIYAVVNSNGSEAERILAEISTTLNNDPERKVSDTFASNNVKNSVALDDTTAAIPKVNAGQGDENNLAVITDSTQLPPKETPIAESPVEKPVMPLDTLTAQVNRTVVDTKLTNQRNVSKYYYIINNILFDYDDYTLNRDAIIEVEHIYSLMDRYKDIEIELIGHTDSEGPAAYNQTLSSKRAKSVANFLFQKGISRNRIKVLGHGEDDPVAINKYKDGTDAPSGRKLNRNVSIRINNKPGANVRMAEIFVPPSLVPFQDKVYTVLLVESEEFLDSIPNEIYGQPVSLISTDESKMYVMGSYSLITDAHNYLNEVIDNGYPNASVMEKRKFESAIRKRTSGNQSEKLNYTIQVLALKNPIALSEIKDIDSIRIIVGDDGYHRYVYGNFKSINDAQKVLTTVKNIKAYSTAFIRPVAHNALLPLTPRPVKQIDKKSDSREVANKLDDSTGYTIQIMAVKTPLLFDSVTDLEGVQLLLGQDGYYRYIYGNYATEKEARQDLIGIKQIKAYETAFIRPLLFFVNDSILNLRN